MPCIHSIGLWRDSDQRHIAGDHAAYCRGRGHTVALKSDGTVWAWGRNYYGQLGDGTTLDRHTPRTGKRPERGDCHCGGGYHTLALKSDGTVWAWGYNGFGQLGDGTTTKGQPPCR